MDLGLRRGQCVLRLRLQRCRSLVTTRQLTFLRRDHLFQLMDLGLRRGQCVLRLRLQRCRSLVTTRQLTFLRRDHLFQLMDLGLRRGQCLLKLRLVDCSHFLRRAQLCFRFLQSTFQCRNFFSAGCHETVVILGQSKELTFLRYKLSLQLLLVLLEGR